MKALVGLLKFKCNFSPLLGLFCIIFSSNCYATAGVDVLFDSIQDNQDAELVDYLPYEKNRLFFGLVALVKVGERGSLDEKAKFEVWYFNLKNKSISKVVLYGDVENLDILDFKLFGDKFTVLAKRGVNSLEVKKFSVESLSPIGDTGVINTDEIVSIDAAEFDLAGKGNSFFIAYQTDDGEKVIGFQSIDGDFYWKHKLKVTDGRILYIKRISEADNGLFLAGSSLNDGTTFAWVGILNKSGKLEFQKNIAGAYSDFIGSSAGIESLVIRNFKEDKTAVYQLAGAPKSKELVKKLDVIHFGRYFPELFHVCGANYLAVNKYPADDGDIKLMLFLSNNGVLDFQNNTTFSVFKSIEVSRSHKIKFSSNMVFVGVSKIVIDENRRIRHGIQVLKFNTPFEDCH
jgi:hypothetical protein